MPTLSAFYTTVSQAALRGAALDAQIPGAVSRAVEFIERNYNLPYMRRTLTQSVVGEVLISGTDGNTLKSVQIVRWQDSDSRWRRIVQIDPDQLLSSDALQPAGYEHFIESDNGGNQTHRLRFDAAFQAATNVEVMFWAFSRLDLANPSAANIWLVNNAQDALLARTMYNLAPIMREPQLMQMYSMQFAEAVKTLTGSLHELEQGNR